MAAITVGCLLSYYVIMVIKRMFCLVWSPLCFAYQLRESSWKVWFVSTASVWETKILIGLQGLQWKHSNFPLQVVTFVHFDAFAINFTQQWQAIFRSFIPCEAINGRRVVDFWLRSSLCPPLGVQELSLKSLWFQQICHFLAVASWFKLRRWLFFWSKPRDYLDTHPS